MHISRRIFSSNAPDMDHVPVLTPQQYAILERIRQENTAIVASKDRKDWRWQGDKSNRQEYRAKDLYSLWLLEPLPGKPNSFTINPNGVIAMMEYEAFQKMEPIKAWRFNRESGDIEEGRVLAHYEKSVSRGDYPKEYILFLFGSSQIEMGYEQLLDTKDVRIAFTPEPVRQTALGWLENEVNNRASEIKHLQDLLVDLQGKLARLKAEGVESPA